MKIILSIEHVLANYFIEHKEKFISFQQLYKYEKRLRNKFVEKGFDLGGQFY